MSVQPFQFEPERIVSDEDNIEHVAQNVDEGDDQRGEEARVGQNRWCLCTNCVSMSKEKESVCCKELNFLSGNVQGIMCITAHESFVPVCLNRDVLWSALVGLHDRQSAGLPHRNEVTNRSNRYAAYRQFTWWMHGWLGKRIRRVIPSCAVNKIRSTFPEASGIYKGYEDVVDIDHSEIDDAWIDFNDI